MGSEKRITMSDAYRIYTGHRFGRTILSTLFICTVVMLFISFISGAVMTDELKELYTSYIMFSEVEIKPSYPIYCLVYILGMTSSALGVMAWVTVFLKKLANTDICDKNAPGGKYLATVKGGNATFAKAHIMLTAEPLISAFILFFIQNVLLFLYTNLIWGESFSGYLPEIVENMVIFASVLLIPSAVSNVCELINYRINRIVVTAVLFPVSTVLSASVSGGSIIAGFVSLLLLAASEYMIIRKHINGDAVETGKVPGEVTV
ncbi:MAG: hypothetical protein ILP19_09620 [Oscillospiraceae bacterium]|nr:hypothetical protein [Oscillospiraceae bacterium]